MWSQADKNNYEETGLLVSLHFFNENKRMFLKNFKLKAKRSIEKPLTEGPSAYVLPSDETRPTLQMELLRVLQKQHVEVSRIASALTVALPVKKEKKSARSTEKKDEKPEPTSKTFPAGSYVVRMDQPYSRIADALLDYRYWSPQDPQKTPYDDTGWTFGELYGVQVVRVTDAKILDAPMEKVGDVRASGGVKGDGAIFAINNHAVPALATLRYKLKDATIEAAEEAFDAGGAKFTRGTFLIRDAKRADVESAAKELGLQVSAQIGRAHV